MKQLFHESTDQITKLLCSYNGTLSYDDQNVLLELFNNYDYDLHAHQPFLWSSKANDHYKMRKDNPSQLLRQPNMEEVLGLFEWRNLKNTIINYPLDLKLTPICLDDKLAKECPNLYDPRFALPVIYHSLAPEQIIKFNKFVSCGALSLPIAALTSECSDTRSLSYAILSRFHQHLEINSYLKDRFVWLGLIDLIRNGLPQSDFRFPSIQAMFLIQIIDILLHPNEKLYEVVKNYLLANSSLQFHNLPSLYVLIDSSDVDQKNNHQHFVVSWLCDGLRREDDVKLCLKKNVFSHFLLLFHSPICDKQVKNLILDFITKAVNIELSCKILCCEISLLVWLNEILLSFEINKSDTYYIRKISFIIENLWKFCLIEENEKIVSRFDWSNDIFINQLINLVKNQLQIFYKLDPLSEKFKVNYFNIKSFYQKISFLSISG